jgi:hypothetical protein
MSSSNARKNSRIAKEEESSRGRKAAANHEPSVRAASSFPCALPRSSSNTSHHSTSLPTLPLNAFHTRITSTSLTQTQPHKSTTMPRQSRGPASAPKRPSVPTPQSRSAPQQPTQARQASTTAAPPANQHAPPPAPQQAAPAASGGSGLFGQMASTAA